MTTKEQERKALEEIKAIVEKVGGDQSYIGMAFKGCFEIAEDNIANDFGDSWMDRWSTSTAEAIASVLLSMDRRRLLSLPV